MPVSVFTVCKPCASVFVWIRDTAGACVCALKDALQKVLGCKFCCCCCCCCLPAICMYSTGNCYFGIFVYVSVDMFGTVAATVFFGQRLLLCLSVYSSIGVSVCMCCCCCCCICMWMHTCAHMNASLCVCIWKNVVAVKWKTKKSLTPKKIEQTQLWCFISLLILMHFWAVFRQSQRNPLKKVRCSNVKLLRKLSVQFSRIFRFT